MIASYLGIFVAGVLTVLSPCVLPLAPILVGGLVAGDDASRWSRVRASLWFSVGFAVVFTSRRPGTLRARERRPTATVGVPRRGRDPDRSLRTQDDGLVDTSRRFAWMERRVDVRTAARIADPRPMLLGAIFALTWTPCAGPILGGVLTYVAARRDSVMPSVLMLLVFASGVVTPLVLIAVASEYVVPLLRRLGPHVVTIERASGAALVALAAIVAFQPFASSRQVAASTSLVGERTSTTNGTPTGHSCSSFARSTVRPVGRWRRTWLPSSERVDRTDGRSRGSTSIVQRTQRPCSALP